MKTLKLIKHRKTLIKQTQGIYTENYKNYWKKKLRPKYGKTAHVSNQNIW